MCRSWWGGDVSEPGGAGGPVELGAQPGLAEPVAVCGEQEVRGSSGAWVRERSAGAAGGADAVDQGEGLGVDRDHPLGVQLAEGHLEPGAGAGDVDDGVELEVEQLADAQSAGALQQEGVGGQPVG